jgi:signal peptidase I
VSRKSANARSTAPAKDAARAGKEPLLEQLSSFVGFFVYLLVLKSFFLPLFIIPTGSMAETLYGEHATHTCPNCGTEYAVSLPLRIPVLQCPNCRWRENVPSDIGLDKLEAAGMAPDATLREALHPRAGDRIMVHGWPYVLGGFFAPERWEVVVFKVPTEGQTNYIKRLIGLPGETIEIIDGDIFVTPPEGGEARIARKPAHAQRSLWFPYYNHDHPARVPAAGGRFYPRWVASGGGDGWQHVETRRPAFDGRDGEGEILFVTDPRSVTQPGEVADVYGYDGPIATHVVSDARLSCTLKVEAGSEGGYVELRSSKYTDQFSARFHVGADGRLTRVTLGRATAPGGSPEIWAEADVPAGTPDEVTVALGIADYRVSVEVDGRPLIVTEPSLYDVTPEQARARSASPTSPRLAVAARGVKVTLDHLLIERDVYYTSNLPSGHGQEADFGTQGHAITLRDNECYVLGDNSPASLDSRYSFAQGKDDPVGPHLKDAYAQGEYHRGTVPTDQLIGPAFLVYWPGTDALLPDRYLPQWLRLLNQLPGPGRIRWIH